MKHSTATLALLGLMILPGVALVRAQAAAQDEAAGTGEAWRGPLSLGIQVTDERGQPLAGAIVAMRFAEDAGSAGPPLLETDDEGRAELTSIAAGEWQADVRRDGYMLYTAYLHLEPGESPELGFRTRQRTGSFWAPIEVRFYDPERIVTLGGGAVPSEQEAKKEERRIAKREKRQRKREEGPDVAVVVEESPFAAAAPSQESAVTPPSPGGEEEVAARPPEPARQGAPTDVAGAEPERPKPLPPPAVPASRARAAEPSPEEAAASSGPATPRTGEEPELPRPAQEAAAAATVAEAAPVADRPPPAPASEAPATATRPAERPTPPSSTVAEAAAPEPQAAPAPPAVAEVEKVAEDLPASPPPLRLPTIRPNPNLLPAGACPECRAGEWSLAADAVAAPRRDAGGCEGTFGDRPSQASTLIARTLPADLGDFAGSLIDRRGDDDVRRLLPPEAGRQVTELLRVEGAGSCQVVGVVLPRGARYIGFRYQAGDAASGLGECPPAGDCQIGEARWVGNPVVERAAETTVVYALFENRSTERERRPRLIVYFKPRSGWAPPAR